MTYEEQLKIETLNNQIRQRILKEVSSEEFINFYLYHNQKETMEEYDIRTAKELSKILTAFNYEERGLIIGLFLFTLKFIR